jgi:hypothetical protein
LARIQLNRALAIDEAVAQAAAQDIVLLAGKGHESEQEIMGVRHPFSDVAQASNALQSTRGCPHERHSVIHETEFESRPELVEPSARSASSRRGG